MGCRFEIGREIPGTSNFAEISCSDRIKQPKDPDFNIPQQILSLDTLYNNNRDQKIRFSVWNKENKMLNSVIVTIN